MPPLVSIIIPSYRSGKTLGYTIDSALGQSYANLEIIVVNDGSDDCTGAVANSFGSRIVYLSQENGGLSAARNAGIGVAKGEFLLFLDADDLLHPKAVDWLCSAAVQNNTDLAVMGWLRFVDSPTELFGASYPIAEQPLLPGLLYANRACVHAHLVRRSVVLQAGMFCTTLNACEDWDLWLRLALTGCTAVFIPFIGAYYRSVPKSMSSDKGRMRDASVRVALRASTFIRSVPSLMERYGDDMANRLFEILRQFVVSGTRTCVCREVESELTIWTQRANAGQDRSLRSFVASAIGLWYSEVLAMRKYQWCDPILFDALYGRAISADSR